VVGNGYGHLLHHGDGLQDGVALQLEWNYGIGYDQLEDLWADGPLHGREVSLQDLTGPLMLLALILVGHDHHLPGLGQAVHQLGGRYITLEDQAEEVGMGHSGGNLAGPDGEVDLLEDRSGVGALVAGSLAELDGGRRGPDHGMRVAVPPVDVPKDCGEAQGPCCQRQAREACGVAAGALNQPGLGLGEHLIVLQAEEELPGEVSLKLVGYLDLSALGQALQELRSVCATHKGDKAAIGQACLDVGELLVSGGAHHQEIGCLEEVVIAALNLDSQALPLLFGGIVADIGPDSEEAVEFSYNGQGPAVGLAEKDIEITLDSRRLLDLG